LAIAPGLGYRASVLQSPEAAVFPRPLSDYAALPGAGLFDILQQRIADDPFNAVATGIFLIAIVHTFMAARVTAYAHRVQARHDERLRSRGAPAAPAVAAELLHFAGEVEVIFGFWVLPLVLAIAWTKGVEIAKHYLNTGVNYTEPMFVVVIMVIAASRPVMALAEATLGRLSALGGGTPAACWVAILTVGPLFGSIVTEPAAMTICALLLARQFFTRRPSTRLKYATLGLLFVNVSIGGTLTHFAAPPILMVARPWGWDTAYVISHFGWRAVVAILISTSVYYLLFRKELRALESQPAEAIELDADSDTGNTASTIPVWITLVHLAFLVWTVTNSHYPALFVGSFLFFLGFTRATSPHQGRMDLRVPLLVGFFLAGLVIHGGLQAWWIAPLLASLSELPLFLASTILTSFNDNALITYLGTLVPNLSEPLKIALVEGAVTGGGLTVIANAPNPAGQSLLSRFFDGAVVPLHLFLGALFPTIVAALLFRLF
jgi:hypothetical protein